VARRVEQTIAARLELEEGLRELGLSPTDSEANFVWFALPQDSDEKAVVAALCERKVLVRAGAALGRAGCLRVTCGTPAENARFLSALRDA
jgi:histidinol-phosphate aminotransferase